MTAADTVATCFLGRTGGVSGVSSVQISGWIPYAQTPGTATVHIHERYPPCPVPAEATWLLLGVLIGAGLVLLAFFLHQEGSARRYADLRRRVSE